jgi:hypothetical protein
MIQGNSINVLDNSLPPIEQLQKEESAGKKFDFGKPGLEMLPPSYWKHVAKESNHQNGSIQVANWYFHNGDLFLKPLGWDPLPVLEYGAKKYDRHNWMKGMRWGRLVGAFHRHYNKLNAGLWVPRDLSEIDDESGLPHGCHAECCRLFLEEYYSALVIYNRTIGENDCPWNQEKK